MKNDDSQGEARRVVASCFYRRSFRLLCMPCHHPVLVLSEFINVFRSCCRADGLLLLRASGHFSFLLFLKELFFSSLSLLLAEFVVCLGCVHACVSILYVDPIMRGDDDVEWRIYEVKQFVHINYLHWATHTHTHQTTQSTSIQEYYIYMFWNARGTRVQE